MKIFVLESVTSKHLDGYKMGGGASYWPKDDGQGLGTAGIWNLLFRSGGRPTLLGTGDFVQPDKADVVYACADARFPDKTEKLLRGWISAGAAIVASGSPEAWRFAFPEACLPEKTHYDHPYAALAWIFGEKAPQLISPPNWSFSQFPKHAEMHMRCHGRLVAVHGERQTPSRALLSFLEGAPAILQFGNVWYLNGNPFAALQSWMQGQEDLEPWLAWRHRIFWLDEFGGYLCKILRTHNLLPANLPGVAGLGQTTVVLKHDLDYSRDLSYLNMESQDGLAGVHPILRDANTGFWVKQLKSHPEQESAFHFNTASYSRVIEAVRHKFLGLPKRPMRPDRKGICGDGLLNQVRWAKRQGVGIKTLHRHASFLLYPEIVEALDTVYKNLPEVVGSSSMFRAQVLRWGVDMAEGMRGTYGSFPDPQFPYWFPFRLAHAGNGGLMLRGWESTSMMELEPELVKQMLDYTIPDLPQRILVLNYHPAHANKPTFARDGTSKWFRDVLQILNERKIPVRTLGDIYDICNKNSSSQKAPG